MIKKALILIMDGLGDRAIDNLGNKTPLERANTPNFDKLVRKSECGLMYSLSRGRRPGSDTAHLSIFGYDINKYYTGRGPIEAAGVGIKLEKGDVALRGNFATVDSALNIIDRRAGRINDVSLFASKLDGMEIDGIKFIVKPGSGYRAGVVLRGEGLSSNITDADSHKEGDKVLKVLPLDNTKEAIFTAQVLNKFMMKSYEILDNLEENKIRENNKELKANFLLLRGAGNYPEIPSLTSKWGFNKACCIAGGGLYKGIGSFLGMDVIDVEGANALADTNIKGKLTKAVECLNNYDFVFTHIKATDSLAEDGKYNEKKLFIERIDKYINILSKVDDETLIIITSDHSTSSELKAHTADPVPILFYYKGVRSDSVSKFSERDFAKGSLGIINGIDIMPNILNIMGKLPIIGC